MFSNTVGHLFDCVFVCKAV